MEKLCKLQKELNTILEEVKAETEVLEKDKQTWLNNSANLKAEREVLEKDKQTWFTNAIKLEKTQFSSGRIKLDVGGTVFSTSLGALTSQKGSYFDSMFSGRWKVKREEDGSIFIDRDPFVFRHILNFLRGEQVPLKELTSSEIQRLTEDGKFYQLSALLSHIDKWEKEGFCIPVKWGPPLGCITITGPNLAATDARKWGCVLDTTGTDKGKRYWAVNINQPGNKGNVINVGISTSTAFGVNFTQSVGMFGEDDAPDKFGQIYQPSPFHNPQQLPPQVLARFDSSRNEFVVGRESIGMSSGGLVRRAGIQISNLGGIKWVAGTKIGFKLDMDFGTLEFYINYTLLGKVPVFPGKWYPAISVTGNASITAVDVEAAIPFNDFK